MQIRPAIDADVEAARALLRRCRLPEQGVPDELACLLVAQQAGAITGVAGLEVHGRDGLLRSVAVAPEARGHRLASQLCDAIEARAAADGLRELFLLTETAERFFARRGYTREERGQAPEAISRSREFRLLCPDSAVMMRRACVQETHR